MRLSLRATKNWASTPQQRRQKPHRPMLHVEFRKLCTHLKINDNATAAELLGPSWRTCQRYWYDELPIPPALAQLLRLAVVKNVSHDELRALARAKG